MLLMPMVAPADLTRLKDLVSLEGVRDNQLIGYGLVVGLAGTGDKQLTLFSGQSLTNMLKRMGVTVDPTQGAIVYIDPPDAGSSAVKVHQGTSTGPSGVECSNVGVDIRREPVDGDEQGQLACVQRVEDLAVIVTGPDAAAVGNNP